jgi:hypothetical protein
MLNIIQCFSKHCSCHLQGEYVMFGHFWKPYIGQAVGGELDLMVLNGWAEKWAASQDSLSYIRLLKTPNHYILTMKMATAVFAKSWIIFNIQHSSSPKAEVVHWTLVSKTQGQEFLILKLVQFLYAHIILSTLFTDTCETYSFLRECTDSYILLWNTGDSLIYDLIGSWTTVASRAVISRTLISHRRNVINWGSVPGNIFHTIKMPKLTTKINENTVKHKYMLLQIFII